MAMLRATANVGTPVMRTSYGIDRPTVISMRPGRLLRVSVVRAGVSPGKLHDADVLIDAASKNLIALVPCELGIWDLAWPCDFGAVVVPGQGQMLAVAFV